MARKPSSGRGSGRRSASSHSGQAPLLDAKLSDSRQARFETLVARLTASANLSHRWVENPEWVTLCSEFIPGAELFSRKKLTSTLIPRVLGEMRTMAVKETRNRQGTFQLDGWTGGNFHHYLGFMLTAAGRVWRIFLIS